MQETEESLFDKVKTAYLKFGDRSDFVPFLNENGTICILYHGDKGLLKARGLCFATGAECSFEPAEQNRIYELLESVGNGVDEMNTVSGDIQDSTVNILDSSYDDAPIIKLVNQIIIHAVKSGASDIHFEGRDDSFLVRLRIDGILSPLKTYPKSVHDPIIARTKVLADMDVSETRKAQDGRINLKIGNRNVDIRVSCIPSVEGEKVVMRILERSSGLATLEQTGMTPETESIYRSYLSRPNGIILVTGPTGSGKTTTLYASLLEMDRETKNILTIEDPVEYHIPNITQVQVNNAAGITFASAIRSFLRQDPDVILVGEIRDNVTAEAAVQASLTGHLVLSTLHTNDAPTAVSRLIEMDVEPFLLSSSLLVVEGQRLVRKVCQNCASTVKTDDALAKLLFENGYSLDYYTIGKGCHECFNTGYRGRTAIYELLVITDSIRRLINSKASAFEIKEQALKEGFKNMFSYGYELVKNGVTTPQELLSVIRSE